MKTFKLEKNCDFPEKNAIFQCFFGLRESLRFLRFRKPPAKNFAVLKTSRLKFCGFETASQNRTQKIRDFRTANQNRTPKKLRCCVRFRSLPGWHWLLRQWPRHLRAHDANLLT
jgi:hypothetical protein